MKVRSHMVPASPQILCHNFFLPQKTSNLKPVIELPAATAYITRRTQISDSSLSRIANGSYIQMDNAQIFVDVPALDVAELEMQTHWSELLLLVPLYSCVSNGGTFFGRIMVLLAGFYLVHSWEYDTKHRLHASIIMASVIFVSQDHSSIARCILTFAASVYHYTVSHANYPRMRLFSKLTVFYMLSHRWETIALRKVFMTYVVIN